MDTLHMTDWMNWTSTTPAERDKWFTNYMDNSTRLAFLKEMSHQDKKHYLSLLKADTQQKLCQMLAKS